MKHYVQSYFSILYKSYYFIPGINWKSWIIHKKERHCDEKSNKYWRALSLTLRFVATGHSFSDLEADSKIHQTIIFGIVIEVCNAIWDCLKDMHLKILQTKEQWKRIAEKTQERQQFPNCIGAADEKHPLYTLKILGQIFKTIMKVSSAL